MTEPLVLVVDDEESIREFVHRNLESYGLKSIAAHLGVASPDRTYIDAGNIVKYEGFTETKAASGTTSITIPTPGISVIIEEMNRIR